MIASVTASEAARGQVEGEIRCELLDIFSLVWGGRYCWKAMLGRVIAPWPLWLARLAQLETSRSPWEWTAKPRVIPRQL
jgi:hypothetical protein